MVLDPEKLSLHHKNNEKLSLGQKTPFSTLTWCKTQLWQEMVYFKQNAGFNRE